MIRVGISLAASGRGCVVAAAVVVALAVVAGAGYVVAFSAGAGFRHGCFGGWN